jgi:hypothetical protein
MTNNDDEAIRKIFALTASRGNSMATGNRSRVFQPASLILFRYAASILLICLTGLFLVQNYHAMEHIAQLEKQFGRHTLQKVTGMVKQDPSVDQIIQKVNRLAKNGTLPIYARKMKLPFTALGEIKAWRKLCSRNPKACEMLSQLYYHNLKEAYQ